MLSNLPTDKLRLQVLFVLLCSSFVVLKRDCHETTDAERHLRYLVSEQAAAPDKANGKAA